MTTAPMKVEGTVTVLEPETAPPEVPQPPTNPQSPPPSNLQYVVAVVIVATVCIASAVIVSVFRAGQDNVGIIAAIFGFGAPTTLSLLAFLKAQETHLSVNSRLDAFIKNAEKAAQAQGEITGRNEANKRTDELKVQADNAQ